VKIGIDNLPDDILKLKEIIQQQNNENKLLNEQIRLLNTRLFAKKSEKLNPYDDFQARLFNETESIISEGPELEFVVEGNEINVPAHKRNKPGRKPIPDHFPRKENIIDISPAEKICSCGAEKSRIGEETSEKLDIIPQKVIVIRTIRPKYACRKCKGQDDEGTVVAIAPLPESITGKSILSPDFLASLIISKFFDGLPYYRQSGILGRSGIEISRMSMASTTSKVFKKLLPLQEAFERLIKQSYLVGIDETRVQVLKELGRKATSLSYMWVFRGLLEGKNPLIYFRYEQTRSPSFLYDFMSGYQGIVQTDGYAGYNIFDNWPGVTHVGCMAHARRMFTDAEKANGGKDKNILQVLNIIRKLYRYESDARDQGFPLKTINDMRQSNSKPVLDNLHSLLTSLSIETNPGGYVGKAVNYTLGQWEKLSKYIDDGRIPIDNNMVENAIRPFVIGRKNWLFSDSPDGAHASAFFYSLLITAQAQKINVNEYMKSLFREALFAKSDEDWEKLLPIKENWPNLVTGG